MRLAGLCAVTFAALLGAGRGGAQERRDVPTFASKHVRRKALAADYTAGRRDARDLLDQLEAPQLEGFDDEE